MQITAPLLEISDTSKTEFSKPFGGFLGWPVIDGRLATPSRRHPHLKATFALPDYDVQNSLLGWTFTRDSSDGRPPLMWIPFTRTEQEATFSAAAAVSYGCIASIHPTGLWSRQSQSIRSEEGDKYEAAYTLGNRVSPQLASTRPDRFALLHISARSRNARIADPRALWIGFFAPALGAFEALKEAHLPVATINDSQLEREIPAETRVVILPHEAELSSVQRQAVREFETNGGFVARLDDDRGWHLFSQKPRLKQELLDRLTKAIPAPPIRVHGPTGMHAVFFRNTSATRTVVCLVNRFNWFRCEREPSAAHSDLAVPPPCTQVVVEVAAAQSPVLKAFEAVTGVELDVRNDSGTVTIAVPAFPVMACVVLEFAR